VISHRQDHPLRFDLCINNESWRVEMPPRSMATYLSISS
jgi:hypothetical protein